MTATRLHPLHIDRLWLLEKSRGPGYVDRIVSTAVDVIGDWIIVESRTCRSSSTATYAASTGGGKPCGNCGGAKEATWTPTPAAAPAPSLVPG